MGSIKTQYLLIYILMIEFCMMILLLIAIVLRRFIVIYKEKKEKIERQKLSKFLIESMKKNTLLDPNFDLSKFASTHTLLNALEHFNHSFKSENWQKLKQNIADRYLLSHAREMSTSSSWQKRHFAARCFVLFPLQLDKKIILSLLDDSVFLVHITAASAVMQLAIKDGIIKLIHQMSQEYGYAYYCHRDLLLQGTKEVFKWIEELARNEQENAIHLVCLDLLSAKTLVIDPLILQKDITSSNPKIRLAALKVFSHNPQKNSLEVLLNYFVDPNEEVRAQAAHGLQYFASTDSLEKLNKALCDTSWEVRLQAAESLKKMGRLGIAILNQQDPNINKDAYEVANYALQFDW